MYSLKRYLLTALFLTSFIVANSVNAAQVIFSKVNVVDVQTGVIIADQDVIVDGNVILSIESHNASRHGNYQRINGAGKFLMPGLIDAHAHLLGENGEFHAGPVMIAHGITGFRQMNGSDALLSFKKHNRLEQKLAPEILAMPGTILNGAWVHSPEQAKGVVKQQMDEGADFIKVVDLAPHVFKSVLSVASDMGIPVAGHLPSTVSVTDALTLKMNAIEHLGPRSSVLISCSNNENAIRHFLNDGNAPHMPATAPTPVQIQDRIFNPILFSDKKEIIAMKKIIESFDETKCRQMASNIASKGMWQVPTLIRLKTMQLADDPQFTSHPALAAMPAPLVNRWKALGQQFAARIPEHHKRILRDFFELQLKVTGILAESGVSMAVGSDTGGQWVIPGVSYHQELALLSEAGISNEQLIKMATINGAELTQHADLGTIKKGKKANLLLLDDSPFVDIRTLQRPAGIYYQQTWFTKDVLYKIMRGGK